MGDQIMVGTAVADMVECTESYNPREPFQRGFALCPPKEKATFFSSRAIELLKQLYWKGSSEKRRLQCEVH